jgi:hypothetical protein
MNEHNNKVTTLAACQETVESIDGILTTLAESRNGHRKLPVTRAQIFAEFQKFQSRAVSVIIMLYNFLHRAVERIRSMHRINEQRYAVRPCMYGDQFNIWRELITAGRLQFAFYVCLC